MITHQGERGIWIWLVEHEILKILKVVGVSIIDFPIAESWKKAAIGQFLRIGDILVQKSPIYFVI
jgi:hypothetical protein